MDLTPLLRFIPLFIGAFLVYHLIFRQELPSKSLGSIFTYFLGIIIVFLAVNWLIGRFLPDFFNDLLNVGIASDEWQQVIDNSQGIIEDALDDNDATNPPPQATGSAPVQIEQVIVVTATPIPGGGTSLSPEQSGTGPTQYTVVQGDTLFEIARRYNTTVNNIMIVNNLRSDVIQPGQVLAIPAPSQ